MTCLSPRPYQAECVAAILDGFREHDTQLAVLATGLGKTVIFAHVAERWGHGRVLVMAHREELVRQAADKLAAVTGELPAVEMAGERSAEVIPEFASRLVVTSVQTMCRPKRHGRFDPARFGLLVIDEAHHATAPTYKRVIDYFRGGNPRLKVLGVTATPERADGSALGAVFSRVAYRYGIAAAVEDGWLVPVVQKVVKVEGLDFSKVRTVAGDFKEDELERVLMQEKPLHEVAAAAHEIAGRRPTLVFAVSVAHARALAAVLNRYRPRPEGGPPAVRFLEGRTPPDQRREVVAGFLSGQVEVLVNCGLFLEGFDAPATACVVMARPTKSLALYTQVLGRGTRPLPGVVDPFAHGTAAQRRAAIAASGKPDVVVLDFAGNAGRHKIVDSFDIFAGSYSDEVRSYARKLAAREGRAVTAGEALRRAKAVLDFLAEEEDRRRRGVRAGSVRYHERHVSPFDPGDVSHRDPGAARAFPRPGKGAPATDKQVAYLVSLGVREGTARGYSRRQASAVIDDILRTRARQRGFRVVG